MNHFHLPRAAAPRTTDNKLATGAMFLAFSATSLTSVLGLHFTVPHFTAFHAVLEITSLVIAMLSFGVSWNAYATARPGDIVIIAAVLFGGGLIDLGHFLSYSGMPSLITPASPQKAISFWLAGRMLVAAGMLLVALKQWPPMRRRSFLQIGLGLVVSYVCLTYDLILFAPERLPVFFVPGSGMTLLKIFCEYLIAAIYCVAAVLFRTRGTRDPISADLFSACISLAMAEVCLTMYSDVADLLNACGHVFKIVAYSFIYRAVFVQCVRQPFDALRGALERERRHAAEQHAFVKTFNLLEEAVLELDEAGLITRANQGWWTMAGLSPVEHYPLRCAFAEDDQKSLQAMIAGFADGSNDESAARLRLRSPKHSEQWVEVRLRAERDERQMLQHIHGVLHNITHSYLQERRIAHMAMHDSLTDLPNRTLFEARATAALAQARDSRGMLAVCFIDIDHFKDINDTHGHKVGDALLMLLASLIRTSLDEDATLARWGGDEFVLLLPALGNMGEARAAAGRIRDLVRQTFFIDGLAINTSFSIGIAAFPGDDASGSLDTLLMLADRAMFHAKGQGRNNFQLYAEMGARQFEKRDLNMQARLASAIRENCIEVWFQPQIDAGALPEQHRLVGVEALARWNDDMLGWVSPGQFIGMAENLGLITELGRTVRRSAFSHFQRLLDEYPGITLSINVSKRELFSVDFLQLLLEDAQNYRVPVERLILEVTESVALTDVDGAERRLHDIRNAGIILSIDDFGTGYASLSQLHELPIGELKVDISFVRRVKTPQGLQLVTAIVQMAKALGLHIVAEGVEDAITAEILQQIAIDTLQGYYFGKPCPANLLEQPGPSRARLLAATAA